MSILPLPRSKCDDELYERLKELIKSTVDERLFTTLCTYRGGGSLSDAVTDDRIMSEVQAIVERYFMLCNQLIDEHGLVVCFENQQDQKEKCKPLIESLTPSELKSDLHNRILEKALKLDRDFRRRQTLSL
ncbi:uncharacterized protein PITG_15533 [Phytophthora infestans T30-4]|uniref:Uncharacterized protein n=1 Tax=Phytophthora infestans (strain T30-4) TaxID=403677 RepID=D0NT92_PHYIT|nr:uncharacterized protein PITG_15533 [Phytophthora infestans T30-4]EEY64760.1 hypothetical protein PITG_15533 [Phytophthora infestans T30-4]|eukprot:XP_002897687.1 hypothetical protein PITG_15533 [Phytophthora infestans T30-4]